MADKTDTIEEAELGEDYPPEQPLGAESYGVTGGEGRVDEPINERVAARERGDDPDPADAGTLVDPDQGGGPDTEKDLVAEEVGDDDRRPLAPDDEFTGDETTRDVAPERTPRPAEEEAVHLEEAP